MQRDYINNLNTIEPSMPEGTQIMSVVIWKLQCGRWTLSKTWNRVLSNVPKTQKVVKKTKVEPKEKPKVQHTLQEANTEEWDL